MNKLLKLIEDVRLEMNLLAETYSLTDSNIIEQSERLDKLLNTYYNQERRYRNGRGQKTAEALGTRRSFNEEERKD